MRTAYGLKFEKYSHDTWVRFGKVGELDIVVTKSGGEYEVHVHEKNGEVKFGPFKSVHFNRCVLWGKSRLV